MEDGLSYRRVWVPKSFNHCSRFGVALCHTLSAALPDHAAEETSSVASAGLVLQHIYSVSYACTLLVPRLLSQVSSQASHRSRRAPASKWALISSAFPGALGLGSLASSLLDPSFLRIYSTDQISRRVQMRDESSINQSSILRGWASLSGFRLPSRPSSDAQKQCSRCVQWSVLSRADAFLISTLPVVFRSCILPLRTSLLP